MTGAASRSIRTKNGLPHERHSQTAAEWLRRAVPAVSDDMQKGQTDGRVEAASVDDDRVIMPAFSASGSPGTRTDTVVDGLTRSG